MDPPGVSYKKRVSNLPSLTCLMVAKHLRFRKLKAVNDSYLSLHLHMATDVLRSLFGITIKISSKCSFDSR